jgi:glycerate kinase
MRILCAPDSFKESLDATAVAAAMAAGAGRAGAAAVACPVADGGEGTLDVLTAALRARVLRTTVTGPDGRPRAARFAVASSPAGPRLDAPLVAPVGIVEMAEASGLARLAADRRDPTRTTSYGTGELIAHARRAGAASIIVAVGGSATCDGGAAIVQALGGRLMDARGGAIAAPMTGGALEGIAAVARPPVLPPIVVACDVRNPLLGPRGAASVYAPQKGATPAQVEPLERGLAHLARLADIDASAPGMGAAGGAPLSLAAFCGAVLREGAPLVLSILSFAERCRGADLVLAGEGRLDGQTREGKAVRAVAEAARREGRPTWAIAGSTGPGAEECLASRGGFLEGYVDLSETFGARRAWRETATVVALAAEKICRRGQTRGTPA